MGSVFTEIAVTNKRDEILAEAGYLPRASVRRMHIPNVLVDSGATTLCLRRNVIMELGLPLKRKIMAATTSGEIETELYEQRPNSPSREGQERWNAWRCLTVLNRFWA